MGGEIADLSAVALVRLYRRRELSPVEAVQAALDRIERLNPRVNAFCLVRPEEALAAARESEARWQRGEPAGLVDGVPATIKDLLLSKGWPTRRGSLLVDPDQPWTEDAPMVARLREHGAVFLGKTTTPEFGWKGLTDGPLTGLTGNPWNPALAAGGSSGGAAVAAALGMGVLHTGTDGGGSIRIPAAFCGVYGLKTTFGRVPFHPPLTSEQMGCGGPITRTVADAALMLTAMARPDPRDWQALPEDGRDWRIGLEDGVVGLRVAYSPRLGGADVDAEVAAAAERAARSFEELGARVAAVHPPLPDLRAEMRATWAIAMAEAHKARTPAERARMDPGLVSTMDEGRGYDRGAYFDLQTRRRELGSRLNLFLRDWDLLLTPGLATPAFAGGIETPNPARWPRWLDWSPFSAVFNWMRVPAAVVPCGLSRAGLPLALQIVGPLYREDLVLRASRAFESLAPFPLPPTD